MCLAIFFKLVLLVHRNVAAIFVPLKISSSWMRLKVLESITGVVNTCTVRLKQNNMRQPLQVPSRVVLCRANESPASLWPL